MFHFALGKLGAAIRAGTGSAGEVVPLFSRDYEATGSLGADATFTRASTATVTDFEGLVKTTKSGEARFDGLRRVENLNHTTLTSNGDDFASFANVNFVTITTGISDPKGGNSATRISTSGNVAFYDLLFNPAGWKGEVVSSIYIRLVSGSPIQIGIYRGINASTDITSKVNDSWQRFASDIADVLGLGNIYTGLLLNGTFEIDVWHIQTEEVTGQINQSPSEYVGPDDNGANVDGVKYFATENGNTVTDNVVTEGTGAAITGGALLMEQAATNYLLNSSTPATQTTGSLGTGNYVLWVEGSGSAAVTAGTATITGGGTATDGTPNTFTVTGAGTVTVTVTGTLDRFQLEAGSTPTSYIPTSGSAVTRAADALSYSGIAADNETRAITDAGTVDVDDWDGVVDATINGADNLAQISSITVYTTGERPA